jgi:hypothetical protein
MKDEIPIMARRSVLLSALYLVTACGGATRVTPASSSTRPRLSPVTVPWCVVPGSDVDSGFAIAQARHLFDSRSLALEPHSVERVVARLVGRDSLVALSFPEGWLVRLMPVAKNTLGGGGLVWVDGATGCPILLIRYE